MSPTSPRQIWLYIVLAFALTWVIGIPLALSSPSDSEPGLFDISQLGALGPAAAALIMIYREKGREGLREFFGRIIKWRIGITWYLVILILPLIWTGILPSIILSLLQNDSLPAFTGPAYGAPDWKNAWWFFLYILVIGGGQEEPGWRGYLLPKLQEKYNALVSSLLVGIVWTLWHLPFLFIPGSSMYGAPLIGYLIQLTSISLLMTWIYNNTGSIFACILYHTWMNFVGAYLMVDFVEPIYGLVTLFVQLAILVGIILIYGPKHFSRQMDSTKT